jgi:hypothetical protein
VSLSGKSVLVTGCDSGFGYELALHLEKMVRKRVSVVGYSMPYSSCTVGHMKTNDYCLLGCDAMWSDIVLPVYQRNLLCIVC